MQWRGKLIGLLLGLVTRRPILVLLGVVLGHLYDVGVFGGGRASAATPPPPTAPAGADPYATLGVSESDSDEHIEAAYRRLMSEVHPDRVASAGADIREQAERRSRDANAAWDQIKRQRGL
jgi:hypothetical protein